MPVGKVTIDILANTTKLVQGMTKAEKSVKRSVGAMKGVVVGLTSALSLQKVVKYGDTWANLNGRLKLVTDSTEELTKVQKDLFKVAQDSRVSLEGTVNLYTKMARSTKELGTSQKDLKDITQTISKALTISGATAIEADAALRQLGQGMASGVLRGEELNSVMEQTPRLAEAIAKGMGITLGQLRDYGKEGKITAEAVVNALKSQGDTIEEEFKQMLQTVGQAFTKLNNVTLKTVGDLSKAFGANEGLAGAISKVADYLNDFTQGFIILWSWAKAGGERTGRESSR